MIITKQIEFDAGHRIPNHKSKCRSLHGHRYKVEIGVYGSVNTTVGDSEEGMIVDFGDLKTMLIEKVHDPLDHGFIYYKDDVLLDKMSLIDMELKWIIFPYIPTAENIAKWVWEQLIGPIEVWGQARYFLDSVQLWETPTSTAIYKGR